MCPKKTNGPKEKLKEGNDCEQREHAVTEIITVFNANSGIFSLTLE